MRNRGATALTVFPVGAPARPDGTRPTVPNARRAAASSLRPGTIRFGLSAAPAPLAPGTFRTQHYTAPQHRRTPAPDSVVMVHRGREFVVKRIMAELFLKQAGRIIMAHGSELVPLAHRDGVDLLFITRTTPLSVHDLS